MHLPCMGAWHRHALLLLLLLLITLHPQPAMASEGDRSPAFQHCQWHCHATGCTTGPTPNCRTACPHLNSLPVPLPLRLAAWSCMDDCKYACMVEMETARSTLEEQRPIKYFGKWPFRRMLGMQEAASVLLSLANLAVHVYCFRQLARRWGRRPSSQPPALSSAPAAASLSSSSSSSSSYPYLWIWSLYAALHVNAWFWSAVFHCRDTPLTERLDYSSATALVVCSACATAVRALWRPADHPVAAAAVGTGVTGDKGLAQAWEPACPDTADRGGVAGQMDWAAGGGGRSRRGRRGARGGAVAAGSVCAALGVALALHLRYMLLVKFDYGWNMKFCLAVGVANAVGWLLFCHTQRHPHRGTMYCFLVLVHAALLLEILDFPAFWGLVDAHAAWHAATIPLVPLFYRFLHGDAQWVIAKRQLRQGKVLS